MLKTRFRKHEDLESVVNELKTELSEKKMRLTQSVNLKESLVTDKTATGKRLSQATLMTLG